MFVRDWQHTVAHVDHHMLLLSLPLANSLPRYLTLSLSHPLISPYCLIVFSPLPTHPCSKPLTILPHFKQFKNLCFNNMSQNSMICFPFVFNHILMHFLFCRLCYLPGAGSAACQARISLIWATIKIERLCLGLPWMGNWCPGEYIIT